MDQSEAASRLDPLEPSGPLWSDPLVFAIGLTIFGNGQLDRQRQNAHKCAEDDPETWGRPSSSIS